MIKNFNQLNEEYVPNNKSTNFSNSTCRRRLLDKFIGAGKWEYVYNGNKAVAVKIADEEEVVEEVIEEAVEMEDLVEELELELDDEEQEIETEADCDAEIARCKNDIDILEETIVQLQARIVEMKNKKIELCDIRKAFRGIKFTKYAKFDDIQAVYTEALRRYNLQKGKPGIEAEFDKVRYAFLKQVCKHVFESSWSACRHCNGFNKKHPNKSEWNNLYEIIWKFANQSFYYSAPETAEEALKRNPMTSKFFDEKDSWEVGEYREYIPLIQYVLGQCATLQSTPEYQKLSDKLEQLQDYIAKFDLFNARGRMLYDEFKLGWTIYFNNRKARYEREKQEEQERRNRYYSSYSGYSSSYSKYFSGCSTEVELKKKHREWAKKLHPDRGGNAAQFRAMQEEYETLKKRFSNRSAC